MTKTNNPKSDWYWKDWKNDDGLRLCSYAARGLWMDMLCLMAQADRRGHLEAAGRPLDSTDIARLTGGSIQEVETLISELESNGVFTRDGRGVIRNRRMVRDETRRKKAQKNGRMGGNPALKKARRGDAASRCNHSEKQQSVNPPVKGRDKGGVGSGVPPPIPLNHSTTTSTTTNARPDDPCAAVIAAFDDARAAAFGERLRRPWPSQADRQTAQSWLSSGADIATLRAVFAETMGRKHASEPDDPPGTLAYCDAAVRKSLGGRRNGTGGSAGGGHLDTYGMSPEELRELALEKYRKTGIWPRYGGEKPEPQGSA